MNFVGEIRDIISAAVTFDVNGYNTAAFGVGVEDAFTLWVKFSAVTNGTVTPLIQDTPDNGTTWYTIVAMPDLTSAQLTQRLSVSRLDYNYGPLARVSFTVAQTPSTTFSGTMSFLKFAGYREA